MSLYRKYRPSTFSHLVGQEHVRITLMNALKTNNVNHAYLFTGPRGTGKTSTARLLAKAINCINPIETEPCEKCDICMDINQGTLIDLIEIDAASNRGIDEIRDLKEKIQFAPTRAKNKTYIIDEVHMLTKEAFNALLKTLEEPPSNVYFILATTEVHKIPETILSRCQRFDFKRIDDKTLFQRLQYIANKENIETEEEALQLIVHHVQGGLRDAIGLLEQLTVAGKITSQYVQNILGISGRSSIEKIYEHINNKSVSKALNLLHTLYQEGIDLVQLNKDFLEFLRQKLLNSVYQNNPMETTVHLEYIRFFQESVEHLKYATIPQLPLEIAIIQACKAFEPLPIVQDVSLQKIEPALVSKSATLPEKILKPEREHQTLEKIKTTDVNSVLSDSSQNNKQATENSSERESKSTNTQPGSLASQSIEITFETIQKKWKEIPTKMKTPGARRLFPAMTAIGLNDIELTVSFQTNFAKEKMMEIAHRSDFEEALSAVFNAQLKLVPVVEKIHLAGENTNQQDNTKTADDSEKLLEVFGGEFV